MLIKHHTKKAYLSIYGSTTICWTLALFQILIPVHNRYDSLDGKSAL
jgi:hypothetical protein